MKIVSTFGPFSFHFLPSACIYPRPHFPESFKQVIDFIIINFHLRIFIISIILSSIIISSIIIITLGAVYLFDLFVFFSYMAI